MCICTEISHFSFEVLTQSNGAFGVNHVLDIFHRVFANIRLDIESRKFLSYNACKDALDFVKPGKAFVKPW